MKLKKIFLITIVFISTFMLMSANVYAQEESDSLTPNSKSAILIDAASGNILYERNMHQRLAPASMTKIMTMLIIFDNVKEGNLSLDDYIITSEHAASMGGSQIYLEADEKMTLNDMLKAIAISSANDAAVAVAERIAGTEKMFVQLMNERAAELGLENTHFKDATGLEDAGHFSSAHDMAVMSRHLINRHGQDVLAFTNIREDYLRKDSESPFWLVNTNKLIGKYENIDGLKTGWTNAAGYSLAATMFEGDNRLISVVMGHTDPKIRNKETVELLKYGFGSFKFNVIFPQNHVVKTINNIKFNPSRFDVVTSRSVVNIERNHNQKNEVTYEIILNEINDALVQGQEVGELKVFVNGNLIDTVSLIVLLNIRTNNFFQLIIQIIRLVLT